MTHVRLPIATLLGLFCATFARAQQPQHTAAVPKLVRFSGAFHPADGKPAQTMESVTLSVYRDQASGNALWHEIQNVAVETDGHYSVLMGAAQNEGIPLDLFTAGEARWLGVQFNRPAEAEQPRVLLVSVPYALKASDAETLGGRPASAYLLAGSATGATTAAISPKSVVRPKATPANSGQPNYIGMFTNTTDLIDSAMYQVNGNIGISTTAPLISLDARTGSLPQMGIAGTTDYLTFFASDQFGPAIYWDPGKDMRFGKGGTGLYNPFGFTEQMRIQSSTGNVGIGTKTPGAPLEVDGAGSMTIFGNNTAASGSAAGVSGLSTSTSGTGVSGSATSTSGNTAGVYGQSASPIGFGVWGNATATLGAPNGVLGTASSPSGVGVFGNATSNAGFGIGVSGTTASFDGVAVKGVNTAQGLAGQFLGQVQVVGDLAVMGNLTKSSGSFKIDHPLDPANKYLSHSFVESPDMMNVYNGMARLDAKGEAWVNLPEYFEALNADYRYQLTAIGAPAPRLYVARKVSQNRFKIAGGRPGGEVSWQVTGIRHDAYANAHRIPVAEDKPAAEQGTYLHPDLYRQGDVVR